MQTRLHSKYPDLARAILAASNPERRCIAQAAGLLAITRAGLDEHLKDEVLACVNGAKPLEDGIRSNLEKLQSSADDTYLDILDSLASEEQPPAEAMNSFIRARALSAILGAVAAELDPSATTDVVYEALASGQNDEELIATIRRLVPWGDRA